MKETSQMEDLFRSLPKSLQEYIEKVKESVDGEEDYIKSVMAGYCPNCSSDRTIDGYEAPLNDITVAICLDCHSLWCLECGEIFDKGQTACGHWTVCDKCAVETDGGCEYPPFDCSFIKAWKNHRVEGGESSQSRI